MNWNKIISIFIVLFLGINLGIYAYREISNHNKYTLSNSRIYQLERVMKQKGVTMYAYLPDFYPKAKLELRNWEWKKDRILSKIFAGQAYRSEITYEVALADTYKNESQVLSFYTGDYNGTLYYKGVNPDYVPDGLGLAAMESTAIGFVKDLVGENYQFEVTHRKIRGEEYLLEVNGRFANQTIFSTYFQIQIGAGGIREAIGRFYEPVNFFDESQEIYAFDEVMYYFMNEMEEQGHRDIIIKDVDVGYYILDSNSRQLTIEATPVYRIILEASENIYYIDAYKNELLTLE